MAGTATSEWRTSPRSAATSKFRRVKRGLKFKLVRNSSAALPALDRTFVGQLERGQSGVNVGELARMARALRVRQADLLPERVEDRRAVTTNPGPL